MNNSYSDQPNPEQPVEAAKLPCCPHCEATPITVQWNMMQFGKIPGVIFSCGICKKVINVQALGNLQADVPLVQAPTSGFKIK